MLRDMKEDIHDLIGGQSFGSIEEVQAVLDQYQQQKNEVPVDDFHGLSSEQMHRFLQSVLFRKSPPGCRIIKSTKISRFGLHIACCRPC